MVTSSSNRRNGLRWAGLIVGLAGVVWFVLLGMGVIVGGGELFAVSVVYAIPLLAGILIALKWPLIGGILLIAMGLFWMVFVVSVTSSTTLFNVLQGLARWILWFGLPMLGSGILFLFSRKREES